MSLCMRAAARSYLASKYDIQNTRNVRWPKADEARLMRLWISFVRSPENERIEQLVNENFRVFKLLSANGKSWASGDSALRTSVFVVLTGITQR